MFSVYPIDPLPPALTAAVERLSAAITAFAEGSPGPTVVTRVNQLMREKGLPSHIAITLKCPQPDALEQAVIDALQLVAFLFLSMEMRSQNERNSVLVRFLPVFALRDSDFPPPNVISPLIAHLVTCLRFSALRDIHLNIPDDEDKIK